MAEPRGSDVKRVVLVWALLIAAFAVIWFVLNAGGPGSGPGAPPDPDQGARPTW